MMGERLSVPQEAPRENFSRGLFRVEIPELGKPIEGKVRDSWIVRDGNSQLRVLVTTDRQSAFDSVVCTTPGKGQVLNLMSAFWFKNTRDIIPNHMIDVPHPNVLIARQAVETLPVEVVLRRFMARSSTETSVFHNYAVKGRRIIYGIEFPEGLKPNQEFPMGTIVTPTTKESGGNHDQELTDAEASELVDRKLGKGMWSQAKTAAQSLFELARLHCMEKGLILADTKYEFGIDENGQLMLIDEVHTPDSSRFWLASTYPERFARGETPEAFDKEILRGSLADRGFTGEGPVPKVDPKVIDQMSEAYEVPYRMITGKDLPAESRSVTGDVRTSVIGYIATAVFN